MPETSQTSVQSAAIKSHVGGVYMLKLSERKAVNRGLQVGISMGGCLGFFLIGLGFLRFFCFGLVFCSKKNQQRKDVAAKQQRYKEDK